ncbi:uncharacterized protein RAG0_06722 [Rhynchosporium agropyri]|uniref:Uncharacterized protein n=1 Tax=Rhynchosporium agropyri TaxID=914238 RepID=A0A1E1KIK1_9HELO|nr:uncharacterized protein RAG0_06722 [Rhynchosporium agropyri]
MYNHIEYSHIFTAPASIRARIAEATPFIGFARLLLICNLSWKARLYIGKSAREEARYEAEDEWELHVENWSYR